MFYRKLKILDFYSCFDGSINNFDQRKAGEFSPADKEVFLGYNGNVELLAILLDDVTRALQALLMKFNFFFCKYNIPMILDILYWYVQ